MIVLALWWACGAPDTADPVDTPVAPAAMVILGDSLREARLGQRTSVIQIWPVTCRYL